MRNGVDNKRVEEASTFARWGKSIANVFKPKKEVEKHEPVGPSINPEALTAQKREWIDSQAAQVQQSLATWPEHLFEHFFVVGLPPDIEVTQIAQDLWAQELKQRQAAEEHPPHGGVTSASATSGAASNSSAAVGGRSGSRGQQPYDKAPRPAYDAQVLFRHPAAKPAPLSDQELVDLCFPHKVAPAKLRRSPSMSSLHEVVYGRNAAARDEQCFIFLLKVGTSLPLYGICCAVPEVLHRPPHLARHLYPSCRMPFRSVMIAAPRVYCLLSHYPFFDLHFQVLNVILGMERLHRTIDFNLELDGILSTAGVGGAGLVGAAGARPLATSTSGASGRTPPLQQQQQQHLMSSRSYCPECANAITDMYPGLLQPAREGPILRYSRSGRTSVTSRLIDDLDVAKAGSPSAARGSALHSAAADATGLPTIRTHGSGRRLSDPGSSASPCLTDPEVVTGSSFAATADLRQASRLGSSCGGAASGLQSPAGHFVSDGVGLHAAGWQALAKHNCCQTCGRVIAGHQPFGDMPTVPEQEQGQGLLEEASEAIGTARNKLASLPRAVAANVTEAAAAAAVVLRRVSPGPGAVSSAAAASSGGGGGGSGGAAHDPHLGVARLSLVLPSSTWNGGGGDRSDSKQPPPHSDSYLSSDMGTPNGALHGGAASLTARTLVAAPAEAVSTLALLVRDSLKAIGSTGGRRRRLSAEGFGKVHTSGDGGGGGAAATAAAGTATSGGREPPDGLLVHRLGPDQRAFINPNVASQLPQRQSAFPRLDGGAAAAPFSGDGAAAVARQTILPTWHSSLATIGGPGSLATNPGSVSLVQQLMRSVMAPLSPLQVAAALAASESYVPSRPGGSSGVQSTVNSPQLPASPKQQAPQHQQQADQAGKEAAWATQPAGHTAGPSSSWSFLQRLGRRSQARPPADEALPPDTEKDEQWGAAAAGPAGESTPPPPPPAYHGGAAADVAALPERPYPIASAFATAVDLAAAVEQQIAAPWTTAVYSNNSNNVAGAATGQSGTDSRADEAAGPRTRSEDGDGSGGALVSPLPGRDARLTESPGGWNASEPGSHYASLPPSIPESRRVTAAGDGAHGRDGREDGRASSGVDGECAGAAPPPRRALPSVAAAVLAAAPRLLSELSAVSANPSEASFYSAEGMEEECTPRGDGTAAAADAKADSNVPSPFQIVQQDVFVLSGQSESTTSETGHRQGHPAPGEPQQQQQQSYGNAAVAAVGPTARGGASLPLAGTAHAQRPGGATHAATVGPSRLGRASASQARGPPAAAGGGAATLFPAPPTPQQLAPPCMSPSPQLPLRSSSAGGAGDGGESAAAAAAVAAHASGTPSAAATVSLQPGNGVASPPPIGVAVTGDMAHHFSPRHALDQLYGHPLVHPGEQITLRFGGVATLQFTRPVLARRFTVVGHPRAIQAYAEAELADGLQHWTTAVLCRSLSLENLLQVLTAVLLERQVVVFCPHISVLSCCVLGLLPLLRPFGWQSLLLPFTPVSMMGFLEAPVPFVLGVQYKTSDVMARCSHLIRVNVYKDQVKNAGAPLPQLPGLKRLMAALAPHHALLRRRLAAGGGAAAAGGPGGGGGGGHSAAGTALGMLLAGNNDVPLDGGRSLRSLSPAELAATSSFLSVMAQHLGSVCGDLRPHVITNVGLSKRTGVLMKESLLEVVPPKDKPFVRQFVETQMFSVWSDAVISATFEGSFAAN